LADNIKNILKRLLKLVNRSVNMKLFKSPFSPQSILFGVGLAILTSLLTPVIRENARNAAVKGTQGAIMAGEKFAGAKDKMSGVMNKFKKEEQIQQMEQVSREEFQQLKDEIRKEREQLQELISKLGNMKTQYNQE